MTQCKEYKGYTIIKNYYRGYDGIFKLGKYLTLSTEPKQWIDLQIEYFNERVYNNRANEQ